MNYQAATPHPSPHTPNAGRHALLAEWTERHGAHGAERLAAAEDLADAAEHELTPHNTRTTYQQSWRVWRRFCAATELPEREATRGSLAAFVAWMLREGQHDGTGYAPQSASTYLAGAVVELRARNVTVSVEDQQTARKTLDALAVQLLKTGERRGRGQATAGDVDGLRAIARACPDTLTGARDKALILTSFNYASRAQDPSGLFAGDITLHPNGLIVDVRTGKTKHSVRDPKIPYAQEPEICPVRSWITYRNRVAAEAPEWDRRDQPAFLGIDRWGHVVGGMCPDSVIRAVSRISRRAGIPIHWTGHSLRIGFVTTARNAGKDTTAIADQGGWARYSRSLYGYIQRVDGWEDNASAGLT